ncbi:hypothetical protein [Leisingera sp. NJS204]|uniref:hypothetical protein n=1 Tax=Leisingera sp. NJS204 TaxID=2508307 RepID=UPI0010117A8B|nr:hypothetical protein [Leisingera sp. NJS204]QAX29601.1 hypothetical protein ETW24_09625 [Leisingera sp. NJS204]
MRAELFYASRLAQARRGLAATMFATVALMTASSQSFALTLSCKFQNCYSTGGCKDKEDEVTVEVDAKGETAIVHSPGPRPFKATIHSDESTQIANFVTRNEGGAVHMLTVFSNGNAAFSSHTSLEVDPKPIWISGTGFCEEQE